MLLYLSTSIQHLAELCGDVTGPYSDGVGCTSLGLILMLHIVHALYCQDIPLCLLEPMYSLLLPCDKAVLHLNTSSNCTVIQNAVSNKQPDCLSVSDSNLQDSRHGCGTAVHEWIERGAEHPSHSMWLAWPIISAGRPKWNVSWMILILIAHSSGAVFVSETIVAMVVRPITKDIL